MGDTPTRVASGCSELLWPRARSKRSALDDWADTAGSGSGAAAGVAGAGAVASGMGESRAASAASTMLDEVRRICERGASVVAAGGGSVRVCAVVCVCVHEACAWTH